VPACLSGLRVIIHPVRCAPEGRAEKTGTRAGMSEACPRFFKSKQKWPKSCRKNSTVTVVTPSIRRIVAPRTGFGILPSERDVGLQPHEISRAASRAQTSRRVTLASACIQTLAHSAFLGLNARAVAVLVCPDVRMRRKRAAGLRSLAFRRAAPRNPIKENSANYKPSYSPLPPPSPSPVRFVPGRNSNDSGYYRQRLSALFPLRPPSLSTPPRGRQDGGSRGGCAREVAERTKNGDNSRWPGRLRSFRALTRLIADPRKRVLRSTAGECAF